MPESSSSKAVARWLEPFAAGLWIVFILWTLGVACVWLGGIGGAELQSGVANPDLRGALDWTLSSLDGLWMLLAAANVYVPLASEEGLKTVRFRAVIVVAAAWLVAALSARAGFPLGPVAYTERLGMTLGAVPFGLPFLWLTLILGARSAASRLAPRASHLAVSLCTGGLVLLSDLNLEPIAWKVRVWWLWYPRRLSVSAWPPVSSCLTWLVVSSALAFAFRQLEPSRRPTAPSLRPAVVFAVVNALFLLAHFVNR
jgi:uncharacterized membrane protein